MQERDEVEIGATRGKRHDEVLTDALGREDGLRVATGMPHREEPVLVDEDVVHKEKAARAEAGDVNAEINEKKLARHGDLGGEK